MLDEDAEVFLFETVANWAKMVDEIARLCVRAYRVLLRV
jgi:hypothetical protein